MNYQELLVGASQLASWPEASQPASQQVRNSYKVLKINYEFFGIIGTIENS